MSFSHIVACTTDRVIGLQGKMPWHIKEDLQRFKRLTQHHTVIMGRKTFESIGKPLPNRRNIVVSRKDLNLPGVELVSCIDAALGLCPNDEEAFIIGGGELYEQTIYAIDKIYLTLITAKYDGDAFYPEIPFDVTIEDAEDHGNYSFLDLAKMELNKKNLDSDVVIQLTQKGLTTYSTQKNN